MPAIRLALAGALLPMLTLSAPALAQQAAPHATAGSVSRSVSSDNPLAGHRMGVYQGSAEQSWDPYVRATGPRKKLLAKIALRPKAKWFGAWSGGPAKVRAKVRSYIASSTGGDPDVLVQMTVFRMVPWEQETCKRLPTPKEQRSYKRWIDAFAAGVGTARAAIILQPDGPFALCAPHGSLLPSKLVAYAARKLSAQPNASVYVDAGASDWPKDDARTAATVLVRAGVQYARGFALNATHYTSTAENVEHGAAVVRELASRGLPGKHFVVDTAENGRPFHFADYRGSHPNNAAVCRTKAELRCVTLGIPPTEADRDLARQYVDAYLWFGRPWLVMQTDPFSMKRALAMARTTPY
jgi:endoglucanase